MSLLSEKCKFCMVENIFDVVQEGDIVYEVCSNCKQKIRELYREERVR